MIRYLPAIALVLLPLSAHAQKAEKSRQEILHCAAAAVILVEMSTIAEEKAQYRKQGDAFLEPLVNAAAGDKAREDQLLAEFRETVGQYREKVGAAGAATQMVAAYGDYTDCGGKGFSR